MPTLIAESIPRSAPPQPPRKRWTRREVAAFEAMGVGERQYLELIEGDLINKMGKKRPHVNSFTPVVAWFLRVFGIPFINLEASIEVAPEDNPTSEPMPDLIVLARPSREIATGNPRPDDIRLVVEVSDSSLRFDLTTKADLYARAGIAEYWVLDIEGRRLIAHRDPRDGEYRTLVAYAETESVSPLCAPDAAFPVGSAF